MNERIKELAEQAGFETDRGPLIVPGPYIKVGGLCVGVPLEKFAELLVRECLLCCERTISDPVPESIDTFEQGGIHCRDEIKEHFGVTE